MGNLLKLEEDQRKQKISKVAKKTGEKLSNELHTKTSRKIQERDSSGIKEKFNYKSVMEVPKVEKIVISQGVGEAVSDRKLIENAVNDLTEIAGQKALIVNSKKDVSNFKLRKGMPIGTKVTLRKR